MYQSLYLIIPKCQVTSETDYTIHHLTVGQSITVSHHSIGYTIHHYQSLYLITPLVTLSITVTESLPLRGGFTVLIIVSGTESFNVSITVSHHSQVSS